MNSCPCGGDHAPQHMTGIFAGIVCIKCWQPVLPTPPDSNECPQGGTHEKKEPDMGRWDGRGGRKVCRKCGCDF